MPPHILDTIHIGGLRAHLVPQSADFAVGFILIEVLFQD